MMTQDRILGMVNILLASFFAYDLGGWAASFTVFFATTGTAMVSRAGYRKSSRNE